LGLLGPFRAPAGVPGRGFYINPWPGRPGGSQGPGRALRGSRGPGGVPGTGYPGSQILGIGQIPGQGPRPGREGAPGDPGTGPRGLFYINPSRRGPAVPGAG